VSGFAVRCRDVVKEFFYYEHRTTSLRELFIRSALRRPIHVRRPRFTLKGFNLTVERGEAVALIGPNGSGKSTALRLIGGIYRPTEGLVETVGSLAAVIDLGAGFHPELTGHENVALYGSVMGLNRRELDHRSEEIVEFSGIGDFIDMPIKYYSSGMQARLAFAVTVCLEPDILLVDEVLAVGDQDFRGKCLNRLRSFISNGGTLVVVSHDLEIVAEMCSRAVWLDSGKVWDEGGAARVVEAYRARVPPES
jgi:ABC-type polysaccharide/polyol phosphate transport system ATPase subunit